MAVFGNPNAGKTTIFNRLTGLSQKVGNYPGVTVERKAGQLALEDGTRLRIIDLPGTYSLAAHSPDEMVAVDVLLGHQQGEARPDLVLQ
ncbi:MAG: FeoB small GTPase domain-containing protein, partial [Gemmatimonadales bacterium]